MGKVVIDWDEDDNPITKTLSETEVQANCTKYGRLYDWSTAMGLPPNCNESNCSSQIQSKHRGIFPFGWHLPSKAEWDILVEFVTSTMGLTEDDLHYLLKSKKAYKTESYGWYNETTMQLPTIIFAPKTQFCLKPSA